MIKSKHFVRFYFFPIGLKNNFTQNFYSTEKTIIKIKKKIRLQQYVLLLSYASESMMVYFRTP